MVSIHVRVPPTRYDALYAAARKARISVPELVRRLMTGPPSMPGTRRPPDGSQDDDGT